MLPGFTLVLQIQRNTEISHLCRFIIGEQQIPRLDVPMHYVLRLGIRQGLQRIDPDCGGTLVGKACRPTSMPLIFVRFLLWQSSRTHTASSPVSVQWRRDTLGSSREIWHFGSRPMTMEPLCGS